MKCLLIGSGGREHALAWKMIQGGLAKKIFVAPGNAGTAAVARNISIAENDFPALLDFAAAEKIDLVVIGPEAPLAAGLADHFRSAGRPVFGPGRAAARLETSKVYAKKFLSRHRVPTAFSRVAAGLDEAVGIMDAWGAAPLVVKADGLAAGKGVFICDGDAERRSALEQIFVRRALGCAGARVLIEEKLEGRELSLLVVSDGRSYYPLIPARDHKKVGEGDTGPNTGGMGAVAPAPVCDDILLGRLDREVVAPVFAALAGEKIDYRGVLYFGLMITRDGPRVLEFNARFGDPETQVLLPLLRNDLAALLASAAGGSLGREKPSFRPGAAACVVMASGGYPGPCRKGLPIAGLEEAGRLSDVLVFHAGTVPEGDGRVLTAGGRVLGVTGLGPDLAAALGKAYGAVEKISFEGAFYRRDIGRTDLT